MKSVFKVGLAGMLGFMSLQIWGAPQFEAILHRLNVEPASPDKAACAYTRPMATDLDQAYSEEMREASVRVGRKVAKAKKRQLVFLGLGAENKKVLEKIQQCSDGSRAVLNRAAAQEVFTELTKNPVAKTAAVSNYDLRGDVGFCFGRAVMVHERLLAKGIPQDQIAKIFALGRIVYAGQLWTFHMATMVHGDKNQWWVIDSLFDRLLSVDEWTDKVASFGRAKELSQVRFYVTDPRKFQPSFGKYRAEDFGIPELKRYFQDLFQSLGPISLPHQK